MNTTIIYPENEQKRLIALRDLDLVGSERQPEFDALVEAAAAIFECPIALVSLVEEHDQWFKACCGLDATGTPRGISFCQHAILGDDLLVVPDALKDPRFCDNPLVTGAPSIRFYAGCPLSLDGEHFLGTLCVIDRTPRHIEAQQLKQLRRLGTAVEGLIRTQQHRRQSQLAQVRAERDGQLLAEIASVSGVGGWVLDMESGDLTWTERTREIHEVPPDYVPRVEEALQFYAPEARPVITKAVEDGIQHGTEWDLELPFYSASGRFKWVKAVGHAVFEDGQAVRLIGAFQDITERKQAEDRVKRSEAVHRTTLQTLTEGTLLVGRSGIITSANPAAADLLGYDCGQLEGRAVGDLDTVVRYEAGGEKGCRTPFAAAFRQPEDVRDLVIGIAENNGHGPKWLKLNAVPIDREEEFGVDGLVISLTDITETKTQADTLQVIFDNFPGGVVHYDKDFRMAGCNAEFQQILNYPDELIDRKAHLADFLRHNAARGEYGPGDPERIARERLARIGDGTPHLYERMTKDGRVLEVRGTPLPGGGILSTFFDITSRKQIEQKLVENERLAREKSAELEVMLAHMRQGVSVFDKDGRLTLWNQQYIDIFGKKQEEVRFGVSLMDLIRAEADRGEFQGDVAEHVNDLMERLCAGEVVRSMFKHSSGKVVSTSQAPLPGGGWIGTHEDVTLREKAAEKITYAAHHDMLTHLANRTLFNQRLQKSVSAAVNQLAKPVLMLLDLDRFKPVNDTYGHAAGDALLVQVAERLNACVRSTDMVARLGGDEFAIILPDIRGEERMVVDIAERVVQSIRAPFQIEGHVIRIGVSCGIARFSEHDPDGGAVMKNADQALYDVKRDGRDGFQVHGVETAPENLAEHWSKVARM